MTTNIVSRPVTPLPRDIDVSITINRPQTEIATDLSLLVFVTPEASKLPPNNGRVVVASTSRGLCNATGWNSSNSGFNAIQAWSAQSPRAQRMAIGRIFENPVPAQLMAAAIQDFTNLKKVTDGSLSFIITDDNGSSTSIKLTSLDFTNVANLSSVTQVIASAITNTNSSVNITATIEYDDRLTLTVLDNMAAISFATAGEDGTDVSGLLNLTDATGAQKWDYYEPQGLVEEIKLVQKALEAMGSPAFVVALDQKYRDTIEQKQVADYAEANVFQFAPVLCTNNPSAMDSSDSTNICFYLKNKGYRASSAVYSSQIHEYPDIAYVQDTLSTNYALADNTGTAKFKNGAGISPENINESQLQTLNSRNCNVFVRVGNTARTFREGTQGADTWWTDSYYGVSNLREELQVAVFNRLLRRRKVPYDQTGVGSIMGVMTVVFERFVRNGFLSSRQELDETLDSPFVTRKAYIIKPTPIYLATDSERASRTAPPFMCTAYEAGAIHKVNIFMDLVN